MIAHISPASVAFEESRNTLTYADRAKSIRTRVTARTCVCPQIITELLHGRLSCLSCRVALLPFYKSTPPIGQRVYVTICTGKHLKG